MYIADEVFVTGTAAELTPVTEIDQRKIGTGRPGSVTQALQKSFFEIVTGNDPAHRHWLTPV
jgi:branched-chain amino acid aminotransferase